MGEALVRGAGNPCLEQLQGRGHTSHEGSIMEAVAQALVGGQTIRAWNSCGGKGGVEEGRGPGGGEGGAVEAVAQTLIQGAGNPPLEQLRG